jgi:hypothetical protein
MKINLITVPSTDVKDSPIKDSPILGYNVFLADTGNTAICIDILPTQDIYLQHGLRIAVAFDEKKPRIIDTRKGLVDTFGEYNPTNLSKL